MSRPLADALAKLHSVSGPLPASAFTRAQATALDEFARRTGALRRIAAGAGSAFVVERRPTIAFELERLRPGLIHGIDETAPQRAQNLAMHRSTKVGNSTHREGFLLLKAIGDECRWNSSRGELDVGALCRLTGITALEITADNDWATAEPVWLVENQALFARTDWLPPSATGSVAYYAGTLSGVFLQWLGAQQRTPEVIFFADYDGAGLLNYVRLLESSNVPVTFWLMPRWRELIHRYGNAEVWANNRPQADSAAERLKAHPLSPELEELMRELWLQGLALEHEAAWLA